VRRYLQNVRLLSVLNNSLGLFDANVAILALFFLEQLLIAAIAIAVAEAEELLEQSINEASNGASTCYASKGNGNDLTVVGGFLFLEEKHDISLLDRILNLIMIVYHKIGKMQAFFKKNKDGLHFCLFFLVFLILGFP
jgi:hypothetical protein